jgi:hypothetical protein
MPRYRIITLIDITRTNAGKSDPSDFKIKQQQNFNSLRQAIELRSNVSWTSDPKEFKGRLPAPLEGKATHWIWEFDVEREDTFLKNSDPVGLLLDDLNGVPIIDGLNNTAVIDPAAFQTRGSDTNIWVSELR